MATPGVSTQLIVFGSRLQDDLPGVLQEVADAGYAAFEGGNLFTALGEDATHRVLAQTGLRVSGAHFGYGDYADAETLSGHIAYAQAVGAKHLMCSGVADGKTVEGYRQSARIFNEVGKRLADAGLTFQYHNHDWEFGDLSGTTGMAILAGETDPALVKFNLDVFWLWYAGQDPAAFIAQHHDRAGYFHFKDGTRTKNLLGKASPKFSELGRGAVDLKAAYDAALAANAEWIVAEQDSTQFTPKESLVISREFLRGLGI